MSFWFDVCQGCGWSRSEYEWEHLHTDGYCERCPEDVIGSNKTYQGRKGYVIILDEYWYP